MVFGTRGFLESLITNLSLKIINSKRRIQYSGRKCKYLLYWDDIWYSMVFKVAEYESKLKIFPKNARASDFQDKEEDFLLLTPSFRILDETFPFEWLTLENKRNNYMLLKYLNLYLVLFLQKNIIRTVTNYDCHYVLCLWNKYVNL